MNQQIKIALAMIVKDDSESAILDRCLTSFRPFVDGIFITATGTSQEFKKTKKVVAKHNGLFFSTSPASHPEIYSELNGKLAFTNFAAARNVSFKNVKGAYDWYLWADVDDVLNSGSELRKAAQLAHDAKQDSVFMTYWYAVDVDEKGNVRDVVIQHLRERLVKPEKFKWTSRLHEVLVPIQDGYNPKHTMYDYKPEEGRNLTFIHLSGGERFQEALKRNREILEIQIREEQRKDPRTIFYLAKTMYDMNDNPNLVIELLKEYLEMSGWDEERGNAMEYMGNTYMKMGKVNEAITCYHQGLQEYPKHHLLYLRLASAYLQSGRPSFASHWVEVVLKLPPPTASTTIGNPLEVKLLAASLKYNLASLTSNVNEMLEWAKIRAKLLGGDHDGLVAKVESAKLFNDAAINAFNFARWLKDNGYVESVQKLLDALPIELGREPFASIIANNVLEPREWGKDEICYVAGFGEHFEQWGPNSLSKGIGGSETAVIQLAKEWVKKGWKVTVYADCREEAGVHEGVTWKPYWEINWRDKFNVIIFWRAPQILDRSISANKIFLDLHDIQYSLDYTPERIDRVDKVFFKSQWHRTHVPQLPDEKAVVIGNGIII